MTDNENLSIHIKSVHELIENGYSKRTITRWQRQEKIIKLAPGNISKSQYGMSYFPFRNILPELLLIHAPCTTLFSRITVRLSRYRVPF